MSRSAFAPSRRLVVARRRRAGSRTCPATASDSRSAASCPALRSSRASAALRAAPVAVGVDVRADAPRGGRRPARGASASMARSPGGRERRAGRSVMRVAMRKRSGARLRAPLVKANDPSVRDQARRRRPAAELRVRSSRRRSRTRGRAPARRAAGASVVQPRPNIMLAADRMPRVGTSGTSGVRKARGMLGTRDAQDPHAGAHDHEGEQRPDARQLAERGDRERTPRTRR